jgi:hypothetical protein
VSIKCSNFILNLIFFIDLSQINLKKFLFCVYYIIISNTIYIYIYIYLKKIKEKAFNLPEITIMLMIQSNLNTLKIIKRVFYRLILAELSTKIINV